MIDVTPFLTGLVGDHTPGFAAASAVAVSGGGGLFVPPGLYRLNGFDPPSGLVMICDQGAEFRGADPDSDLLNITGAPCEDLKIIGGDWRHCEAILHQMPGSTLKNAAFMALRVPATASLPVGTAFCLREAVGCLFDFNNISGARAGYRITTDQPGEIFNANRWNCCRTVNLTDFAYLFGDDDGAKCGNVIDSPWIEGADVGIQLGGGIRQLTINSIWSGMCRSADVLLNRAVGNGVIPRRVRICGGDFMRADPKGAEVVDRARIVVKSGQVSVTDAYFLLQLPTQVCVELAGGEGAQLLHNEIVLSGAQADYADLLYRVKSGAPAPVVRWQSIPQPTGNVHATGWEGN